MNRTSVLVVTALAAVLVLLAFVGQRRTSPALDDTGTRLVPGLIDSINGVERIVVTRAGADGVATLVRGETGWTVLEKDGYAADTAKIRGMLVALGEAKLVEEKTSSPEFYDRLGVEPIELETASGTAVAIHGATDFPVLIVGSEANSASRYVRRAEEEQSFLVDRNPDIPRTAAQWLIPDIVDVRGARVESVTIEHADGAKLAISKASADETNFAVADVPDGRELQYAGVANVIGNALRELKLEDAARAHPEDANLEATTEFRTFDGLALAVTSSLYEGEPWLSFHAAIEEGPPPNPNTDSAEDANPSTAAAAEPANGGDASSNPGQEAEMINARVDGWRYRIPSYQHDQLTRRMEDLLKAAE